MVAPIVNQTVASSVAVAVAWLNWQLKGDQRASLMFEGANCGLCVNPRWVVRKKKID